MVPHYSIWNPVSPTFREYPTSRLILSENAPTHTYTQRYVSPIPQEIYSPINYRSKLTTPQGWHSMQSTSELVELRDTLKMMTSRDFIHHKISTLRETSYKEGFNTLNSSITIWSTAFLSPLPSFPTLTSVYQAFVWVQSVTPHTPRHKELAPSRGVSTLSAVAPWNFAWKHCHPSLPLLSHSSRETPCYVHLLQPHCL